MIDILYLACNRLEFTRETLGALLANTPRELVSRWVFYDDGSTDGTRELLEETARVLGGEVRATNFGSPVATMNHYLASAGDVLFAKLDNDTMVPAGWLEECLQLLNANPETELIGIEAMREVGPGPRKLIPAQFVGGIGLFRSSAWKNRPPMEPNGRYGFNNWQDANGVRSAWISPSLPVCLLDRMPIEPWRGLSRQYITAGWQRPWPLYDASQNALWEWFA